MISLLRPASPKTALIASISLRSLCGVEVPWALMYSMSAGVELAVLRHAAIARCAPSPSGAGCGDMVGIGAHPVADDLGVDPGAALVGVLQLFQDHDAGAFAHDEAVARPCRTAGTPSPARRCGWTAPSCCEPGDRQRRNVASAPPAIMTSASPYWISRNASPMACAHVAQADTVQ